MTLLGGHFLINHVPERDKMKTVWQTRMSMIFNEWAKRYSEDPESFTEILDDKGKPVSDYGECCTIYFSKIADEMDAAGILPVPPNTELTRNPPSPVRTDGGLLQESERGGKWYGEQNAP